MHIDPSTTEARELFVLNSSALNCTAAALSALMSEEKTEAVCTKSLEHQKNLFSKSDTLTLYENDGQSSRLVSWNSSELPEIPGLVEWIGGMRRMVGSNGTVGGGAGQHHNSSTKGERAIIGEDNRYHPSISYPYNKVILESRISRA